MFLDPFSDFPFFKPNLNFQISSQYNNLFRSIYVVSFDNGQTNSLTLAENSFISDFMTLGKSFMNIKNNKGPNIDLFRIKPPNVFLHRHFWAFLICRKHRGKRSLIIGLVSLFNDLSTFVGYSIPKTSFYNYLIHSLLRILIIFGN